MVFYDSNAVNELVESVSNTIVLLADLYYKSEGQEQQDIYNLLQFLCRDYSDKTIDAIFKEMKEYLPDNDVEQKCRSRRVS